MNNRYIGALMISPFIIFLFIGGIFLKYLVLILALCGMYEFYKVSKEKNINPISWIGYTICIIYYIYPNNMNFDSLFFIIIFAILISLCIPVLNKTYNFIDISVTFLGFLYIAVFFSFIVMTNNKENGNLFIWFIFISSWVCDTAAYYSGKFFGKRKLCPEVSPKKTVEGSIGGFLGSTIACGMFGMFVISRGVNVPVIHFFLLGALCGIITQFGDLTASSIKRYVGVKDYSNLIPGHGGILDRFDSILFASLVVYYYITFIMRL